MSEEPIIQAMDHLNEMSNQIYKIIDLAGAMSRLGIPAGEDIFDSCENLLKLKKDASRSIAASITGDARRASEASENMLTACIAGVKIAGEVNQ